ncbi:enterochelin esterase domain-containing protein [Gephyromycinifex aptenodytis]|uniref:enterochelin esterase domain-containing protein n=1 Tax=Gephyromycinifex aptenodytis TaxID=2716227 RepID=UPI00144747A6|nr:enterochelin esterase domain-containing protein [Gephyromycinifex aptenodytis]
MERLLPTLCSSHGAPPAADPGWWQELENAGPEQVMRWWDQGVQTPVTGEPFWFDGQQVCEVTFVVEQADPRTEVMVHLNGLTDRHREDITPALMHPVPGTPLRRLSYLLSADGSYGYRLVSDSPIDRHAGRSRPGWLAIHQAGQPDPGNPRRLPHARGGTSSIWSGPLAVSTPGWDERDGVAETGWLDLEVVHTDGLHRRLWLHRPDSAEKTTDTLLVVHDGAMWRRLGLRRALAANGFGHVPVVLIDSISLDQRAADLPVPERIGTITADVLNAVADRLGHRPNPAHTLIAGQSFGGLAAAATLARYSHLARSAIVQSGSFWWHPEGGERLVDQQAGDLSGARVVLQAGTDEPNMIALAEEAAAWLGTHGATTSVTPWRGGHDYAWWRHGLIQGLRELLG